MSCVPLNAVTCKKQKHTFSSIPLVPMTPCVLLRDFTTLLYREFISRVQNFTQVARKLVQYKEQRLFKISINNVQHNDGIQLPYLY